MHPLDGADAGRRRRRPRGAEGPEADAGRRRDADGPSGGRSGGPDRRAGAEHVWPDRDDDLVLGRGDDRRGWRGQHWPTHCEHVALRPGRHAGPRGGRPAGRALDRRRGRGAGLLPASRPDRRPLPPRPVRGRRTDVPNRRSGAQTHGWQARLSRSRRFPGQDPRPPDRAGRDRDRAGNRPRHPAGGGHRAGRPAGRRAAGRLCHRRRPCRRSGAQSQPLGAPARGDGPRPCREAGYLPADPERKG